MNQRKTFIFFARIAVLAVGVAARCGFSRAEFVESGPKPQWLRNPASWSLIVLPSRDSRWVELAEQFPQARFTVALSPADIPALKDKQSRVQQLVRQSRVEVALRLAGDPPIPLIYDLDFVKIFLSPKLALPFTRISRDADVHERIVRESSELKLFLGENVAGFVPGGGSLIMPVCEFLKKRGFVWSVGDFPDSEWLEGTALRLEGGQGPFTVFKVSSLSDLLYKERGATCKPDQERSEQVFTGVERFNNEGSLPVLVLDENRSCVKLEDLLNHFYQRELVPGKPGLVLAFEAARIYENLSWTPALQVWPYSWSWVRNRAGEPGLTVWIGNTEKNAGWDLYAKTRNDIEHYKNSGSADLSKLDMAMMEIYGAQSGDFFEAMGGEEGLTESDGPQHAARKRALEHAFKQKLSNVYKWIGMSEPQSVRVSTAARIETAYPKSPESAGKSLELSANPAVTDSNGKSGLKESVLWTAESGETTGRTSSTQTVLTRFAVQESGESPGEEWVRFLLNLDLKSSSVGFAELYMDINHRPGAGSLSLTTGRNVLLSDADGWEFALTVRKLAGTSWSFQIVRSNDMKVVYRGAAPVTGKESGGLELRAPRHLLGQDLSRWGYLIIISDSENGTVQDLLSADQDKNGTIAQVRNARAGASGAASSTINMWRPGQ